jgi:hypothetical protein
MASLDAAHLAVRFSLRVVPDQFVDSIFQASADRLIYQQFDRWLGDFVAGFRGVLLSFIRVISAGTTSRHFAELAANPNPMPWSLRQPP